MFPSDTDPDLFDLLADVRSYGFTPMTLPPDVEFRETVHAADERIPVEAVEFGTERMSDVLEQYDGD